MATSVSGYFRLLVGLTEARTAVSGAAKETGGRTMSIDAGWNPVVPGTAVGQADVVWSDTQSVGSGLANQIDLNATLTNAFGQVITFAKVRGIAVVAADANTTVITVQRGAANGFGVFNIAGAGSGSLNKSGFWAYCDPNGGPAVTAGTADLLFVFNTTGASANYDIAIVGTSV